MAARKHKRRWVWGAAIFGGLGLLAVLLWPTDRSLEEVSTRVVTFSQLDAASPLYPVHWISDHEFLYRRRGAAGRLGLYLYDTLSRQSAPLDGLGRLLGNAVPMESSPDGKWVLGDGSGDHAGTWTVASVRGTRSVKWTHRRDPTTDHITLGDYSHVRWLGDSRHVAEFVTDLDGSRMHVHVFVHDIESAAVTNMHLDGPSLPQIGEFKVSASGQLIANTSNAMVLTDLQTGLNDTGSVQFRAWSLDKPTAAPRQWTVQVPRRERVDDLEVSPDGGRIAWSLESSRIAPWRALAHWLVPRIPAPAEHRWEVWVSDIDGAHARLIGSAALPTGDGITPFIGVQWLPGGKRLGYMFGDTFFTAPVD